MPKTKNKQIAKQAIISTFFAFLAVFIAPARIFVMTHAIDKEIYGYFSMCGILHMFTKTQSLEIFRTNRKIKEI